MKYFDQKFELSRNSGASNIRSMEGLRGFAVFLIFLVHYVSLVKPWIIHAPNLGLFSEALRTMGNIGVDLFFVLSGYLIYQSLIGRPKKFRDFISRRIERIYPVFIVVFILYLILSFVFPFERKIPFGLYDAIIYVGLNFLLAPGIFPIEPMITVAWSLSYEMFYYLLLPILFVVFKLRARSAIWRVCFFLSLTFGAIAFCSIYGGPIRLIMFISGILLYEVIKYTKPNPPVISSATGLFFLVLSLFVMIIPAATPSGSALKVAALFVSLPILCFVCFCHPSAWLAQFFSLKYLRWLGNMSYSYYLIHGLALKAAFLLLSIVLPETTQPILLFWLILPVMFAATLVPSVILFLSVERSFSLGLNRKSEPRLTIIDASLESLDVYATGSVALMAAAEV